MDNFERKCKNHTDPREVLSEFLKYESDILFNIFRKREDIYIDILEGIISSKKAEDLNNFIDWYRDYLYNY